MSEINFRIYVYMLPVIVLCFFTGILHGQSLVSAEDNGDKFPLVGEKALPVYIGADEDPGVVRALKNFGEDVFRVTGKSPEISEITDKLPSRVVLAGTLGNNAWIDRLVAEGKLRVNDIAGQWETFLIRVVDHPFEGVDQALVITGSDKRGTIFGLYDLSEQIGVSPWYWWADVPVRKKQHIYLGKERYSHGTPAVKYRGIFINDEAPALSGWAHEKFGGFNHKFYEKVFELILRLKGNFLWPAMWGRAFYDDDPLNATLADEYGIVVSTSHHEPLMRAHAEWSRYGKGAWNYETNKAALQDFWKEGIARMGANESIVTLGMRGDGDEPMSEENNIALLEKIIDDQRKIISDVTGKPAEETLQVWTLYKEVQEYYDKGMRVPDDVTLFLCDDNWGNVRKLPDPYAAPRKGGYGMYYHFDYVGGPRNYKWLNTNPIPRIWEQMNLTYRHGVDRIWVVNVGDIKPMELPVSFFLDYAWSPDKWPAERIGEYVESWSERQFGPEYAAEISELLSLYTKYNSRRKPELLDADTYSLVDYREAERVVEDYNRLAEKADRIHEALPESYKDAFYQLVAFPVKACANLNELYVTVAKNRWYAKQGRATTNAMAKRAKVLYRKDEELTEAYHTMGDGKWNHMMSQTHIGYTYWQQPEKQSMPKVEEIKLSRKSGLGVAVEGSSSWWPEARKKAVSPEITPYQTGRRYLDIFNRGQKKLKYSITSNAAWLTLSSTEGETEGEERIWLTVDWDKIPADATGTSVVIRSGKEKVEVAVPVRTYFGQNVKGFIEQNGYIAMEAAHFTAKKELTGIQYGIIPDLGRTGSAVTLYPVILDREVLNNEGHGLEYRIYVNTPGTIKIHTLVSPTLNYQNSEAGKRLAVSLDDDPPEIVSMHSENDGRQWGKWVADNINTLVSEHQIKTPGEHILRVRMLDTGIVLQKIIIDTGGLKPSYLGPEESRFVIEEQEGIHVK
ncbi:Glycosyl hydrolase family 115 [Sinomicrobium oceani]|uniref:Glycosyl hydrolase family 115 n=1 Tax=Sinomicrobium oceani TaxID=1150368 RepID=A0A1K1RKG3_9FLAO|nr:glycosyl hydrolase 115 family protein [Sinomicrobium oceani]SFW72283.1 Glycosyl hydrolase family 115 [Sinomicrobium oceani]